MAAGALLRRIAIAGYRSARDVTLEPGSVCALVGESSSGKSTVLRAIWTLLEPAAPMPTPDDVSRGHERVHVEATIGEQEVFLDARPPSTLNLNREGAPPVVFFPASLRSSTLLAPSAQRSPRARTLMAPSLPDHAGHWAAGDGGLALVRAVDALAQGGLRGHVLLIEEPELFLSPPAQRHLFRLLRRLGARGRNQVFFSTHAPVFLGVDRIDELVLVRSDKHGGTTLLQPGARSREQSFRVLNELDAERAEIFLSRAVLLVEGRTEKVAFPFVFGALGYDADEEAITIVECSGKGNIPLFAEICNACDIPYVVVHDRDAPRGQPPADADRIANENVLRVAGRRRTIMLVPDFEAVAGLKVRRGKPEAAWRRFRSNGKGREGVPPQIAAAVDRVVAAARRAPRTSRRA